MNTSAEFAPSAREFFATRYRYNPADERALNMFGSTKLNEIGDGIVNGLRVVLTFIGVLTLAIGAIVGPLALTGDLHQPGRAWHFYAHITPWSWMSL